MDAKRTSTILEVFTLDEPASASVSAAAGVHYTHSGRAGTGRGARYTRACHPLWLWPRRTAARPAVCLALYPSPSPHIYMQWQLKTSNESVTARRGEKGLFCPARPRELMVAWPGRNQICLRWSPVRPLLFWPRKAVAAAVADIHLVGRPHTSFIVAGSLGCIKQGQKGPSGREHRPASWWHKLQYHKHHVEVNMVMSALHGLMGSLYYCTICQHHGVLLLARQRYDFLPIVVGK